MDDLIVNFAPTGMRPTKSMTPYVPITPAEIARDVRQAMDFGITMVHLHARELSTGEPTHRAEVYGEIIERIREFSTDLVICVSLSGRHITDPEKRSEPLRLIQNQKPDMGSLTLSSMNFSGMASVNSPSIIQALSQKMLAAGIMPELEVFDSGMINYANYLAGKGLLTPPFYFNLLLGNVASAQSRLLHLAVMINDLPQGSLWSLAGFGDSQLAMNSVSIACGGGVRVGLEDNIWFDRERTQLARNVDLIRRVHTLATAHGRSIMTPARFRERVSLEPGNGRYGRIMQSSI